MANVNELMSIEGKLLEIKETHRFDLSLNDNIKLERMLTEIGGATSLLFSLQADYGAVYGVEKLQEYHDKLMSEEVDIDLTEAKSFIRETCDRDFCGGK